MLQSLVITLREGMEAALVIAIVLAYLRRIGREDLRRSVFSGLIAASAASLVGALLLSKFTVNEEALEGWLMLAAAALVLTMVIWMWRKGRTMRSEIESRISAMTEPGRGPAALSIFVFVFLMVLREGVETVLFLSAVSLNTDSILNFMGGLLGLLLALSFGVMFVKGTVRINLRRFFSVTSAILILISVQLAISGVHDLSEAQILPSSKREMAIIGPIVSNDVFFLVAILALTLVMILFGSDEQASRYAAGGATTRAEQRKALYLARRERIWRAAAGATAFAVIVVVSAAHVYSSASKELSPPVLVRPNSEKIVIPIGQVDDGKLHRFAYDSNGVLIRFIIIKSGSDRFGIAFDACQICGSNGYYQDGANVICRNCAAAIYIPSIGQGGGCNPIALKSFIGRGEIVIEVKELERLRNVFASR